MTSYSSVCSHCRQVPGGSLLDLSNSSTAELHAALQKVNAELEDANRELHDLREVAQSNNSHVMQPASV